MKENYNRALKFIFKRFSVLGLVLIVNIINSPLKSNQFTFLGANFLTIFFIGGFLGLYDKNKEVNVNIKNYFIESAKYFSRIVLNLFELSIIVLIDFLIVLFFGSLPIIITQVYPNPRMSTVFLTIMVLMVGIYRLPIFISSFFTPILDIKIYGKIGIVSAKETIYKYKVIWITAILQLLIYMIIFYLKMIFMKSLLMYSIFDILGGILFLIFIIADFDKYKEIKDMQEEIDYNNYTGRYSKLIGRFIM
ncbi:hypothetical protein [Haliovirga abyssi]|uniref:Beta-carotene 15,15'-monooxygenase n=1 Tax=Haliovirga abyssi TaxID=2996794 RepID=A0AAU9D5S2_9FUSO|nr:hypothetical protein [Haliovirga abyssi]BDU49908.1 hypothetical protein HLVA_04770 [Haliovirga abyssi]